MAPVARALAAGGFRVLEPFQRGSGGAPLTVARHVEDVHAVIASLGPAARPALVGSSWGAMLALAAAAARPDRVAALVLVGCGTFDPAARARLRTNLEERIDPALRRRLERLAETVPDPDARLRAMGDLLLQVHSFDAEPAGEDVEPCDARAHEETWADWLRQEAAGVYPAAFAAIRAPVLMLHGAHDPHPGPMIRASLLPHLPQLEYREWERCGHQPWLERAVRDEFLETLRAWLHLRAT